MQRNPVNTAKQRDDTVHSGRYLIKVREEDFCQVCVSIGECQCLVQFEKQQIALYVGYLVLFTLYYCTFQQYLSTSILVHFSSASAADGRILLGRISLSIVIALWGQVA